MRAATPRTSTSRALAVFDKATTPVLLAALELGNELRRVQLPSLGAPDRGEHSMAVVPLAIRRRDELLEKFEEADKARSRLFFELTLATLDQDLAVDTVSTLYGALGVRPGEENDNQMRAALDMFASDDVGRASGMWEPMCVTPMALSLACRKLIREAIFAPKAAELRAACKDARNRIQVAQEAAKRFCEKVVEADAILLMNAFDEWQRPYTTPQYEPLRARMLTLHSLNDACYGEEEDGPLAPFGLLVEREQDRLEQQKEEANDE